MCSHVPARIAAVEQIFAGIHVADQTRFKLQLLHDASVHSSCRRLTPRIGNGIRTRPVRTLASGDMTGLIRRRIVPYACLDGRHGCAAMEDRNANDHPSRGNSRRSLVRYDERRGLRTN